VGHHDARNPRQIENCDRLVATNPVFKSFGEIALDRAVKLRFPVAGLRHETILAVEMSEPRLLCLDGPSLGLATVIVQDIFKHIREVNHSGTSILLVEQNARHALDTASRGYMLQTWPAEPARRSGKTRGSKRPTLAAVPRAD
jgi:ABC-type branched-subunit amino acid transport system ATPase component